MREGDRKGERERERERGGERESERARVTVNIATLGNVISKCVCHTVHRCGGSGSMLPCHAAGPGSIPGRDKFPG